MKPKHLLLLAAVLIHTRSNGQIDLDHYNTSFLGDGKEGTKPVLIVATPYDGINAMIDHFPTSLEQQALARPRPDGAERPATYRQVNVIDSGEAWFFAAGVHPGNSNQYEFRVLLDNDSVIAPWQPIEKFTDRDKSNAPIYINEFKPHFGILGGWKAQWDHFVIVDLREIATGKIICSAAAWWSPVFVGVKSIYTTRDLGEFLRDRSTSFDAPDRSRPVPSNLMLGPNDNSLIVYTNTEITRKEALEYQLIKDDILYRPWGANEFDNNFILLEHLPPGDYKLQLRLPVQRHNVTGYSFKVKSAWYQTPWFKASILLFVALIGSTIYLLLRLLRHRRRIRREKAHQEKLHLELRAIRSQLNPHFIFNALSSIQALVNQKDNYAANRYLSDFGHLLRDSLENSDKDLIALQQEIRILDTYLQLEQLRFGFQYEIVQAPDVPAGSTEIPAALLQPLVENAVKHGVSGLRENGRIVLTFSRENSTFIARVSDNGKGWTPGTETKAYGLKLTEERIKVLNQLLKDTPITMTIESTPGMGATVSINFKNWWA